MLIIAIIALILIIVSCIGLLQLYNAEFKRRNDFIDNFIKEKNEN